MVPTRHGPAAKIAAVLGAAHRSGPWWRCLCPVHGSRTGTSATLALLDGERGLIVICHAGCSRADIHDELCRRGLLPGAIDHRPAPIPTRTEPRDDTARRIELARRIWDAAQDAHGTPVVAYLTVRGISIAPPPPLRWVPALRRPDGTYGPAMVMRIDDIDGKLIGIARTWLYRDTAGIWRRRDRAMLGPAAGGAVRLAPATETLLIGEGIETCLAAMQATAQPAWAALSTAGLMTLGLPPIVRTVIILADHDVSGAGERAARTAAARWLAEGRRVRLAMPPEPGADFADMLAGCAHARITEVPDVAA
jgi:putative DNA primase/helicase